MTPSQQTIQQIRDAIVSGNLSDAEKALDEYAKQIVIEYGHFLIKSGHVKLDKDWYMRLDISDDNMYIEFIDSQNQNKQQP